MKIVLETEIGKPVCEFGYFKLYDPPKAVSVFGKIFVLNRPIVEFTENTGRIVRGYVYRETEVTALDRRDAMPVPAKITRALPAAER